MTDRSIPVDPAQGIVFLACSACSDFHAQDPDTLGIPWCKHGWGGKGRRQKGIQGEGSHVVESAEPSDSESGEGAPGEGRFVPGRWPGLGSCCGGHVVGLACRAGVIAGAAAVTGQEGQS